MPVKLEIFITLAGVCLLFPHYRSFYVALSPLYHPLLLPSSHPPKTFENIFTLYSTKNG